MYLSVSLRITARMPLHIFSRDVLLAILEHAPEVSRVKVLLTCKSLSKLLAVRAKAARITFDELATDLVKRKGSFDASKNEVKISFVYQFTKSTRYIDSSVTLGANNIIYIHSREKCVLYTGGHLDDWIDHGFYHAWMRTISWQDDQQRRAKDNDEEDLIEAILFRCSPECGV